jgi:hypothetical protein
MKLRLTLTALAVTTLGFSGVADAAGLVTSNRPMPRPDYIGAKDGPRLNTRGIAGAYGIPKGSGTVRAGDGSEWRSCPC